MVKETSLNWKTLLDNSRFPMDPNSDEKLLDYPGIEDAIKKQDYSPFADDYQRVVSSSVFRALQDKTQVFSLDASDFIRTRLTHSMEVAAVAKELGAMIIKASKENSKLCHNFSSVNPLYVPDVLATAGLLHDIGNPPFGHFGEAVISRWMSDNLNGMLKSEGMECSNLKDLETFEGNAQTFRLLVTNRPMSDMACLQPTYAVLGALSKYTLCGGCGDTSAGQNCRIEHKKIGYYVSERKKFETVAQAIGTYRSSGEIVRHPLAFLLEAADDIAYGTADFEDAFKKGIISVSDLKEYLDTGVPDRVKKASHFEKTLAVFEQLIQQLESGKDSEYVIHHWAHQQRTLFINAARFIFHSYRDKIMDGDYKTELLCDPKAFHGATLLFIKDIMNKKVYKAYPILEREISAKRILEVILESILKSTLAKVKGDDSAPIIKYYHLLPANVRHWTENQVESLSGDDKCYYLIRMSIDYLCSLTDSGAVRLYKTATGSLL